MPITDYIPQRAPMVIIGELINATNLTAESSFTILPDNIFAENGIFSEAGLIENIAQTAAAMVGYQCKLQNIPVPIGYIAAIKNLKVNLLPDVQSTIYTKVVITNEVLDITILEGTVMQESTLLCSCEMRIVIKNKL